ncbi:serine--tRNA ligase [Candidatus Marinamargulisbacteria bacterium SCGC AG-410-N11]|nr:serine--tRNA ligase [Candidatus Marinamargulisbacteria bacterium SCGC AG-410-N11]
MLNPKLIRDNTDKVKDKLLSRGFQEEQFNQYITLDSKWRALLQDVEQLKQDQNKMIPKGKPSPEQLETLKKLSSSIKEKQEQLKETEDKLKLIALTIPNVPLDSVPYGTSEDDNVEIKKVGEPQQFDFQVKSHDEIGIDLDILDFETAAKITGSRFVLYKGLGAKLERALINFMLETHEDNGYTEYLLPAIVNRDSLYGTGQLPKFEDDQFKLSDTDYYLSPTAEVQLTNIFRDEVIEESRLPINITAYTPCFRKEAGSYGKDIKGLIRQHQFNKIELVKIVNPKNSEYELEKLLNNAEKILQLLEIPYRVVTLCTGDLGFTSAKTYDIEVWLPSQGKYREISSCSNFLDFQSRRAMIRYKNIEENKTNYVHTLNGSGLAVGRTVAAVIENYQTKDGNIRIPEVLKKYLKVEEIKCLKKITSL